MKILVVIDMQNDFIYGPLGTPEAAAIVPKVAEKILSWTGPVYATQDTHFPDYLQTQEGRILPVAHCIQGTNGWPIAPAVRAALSAAAGRDESTLYLPLAAGTWRRCWQNATRRRAWRKSCWWACVRTSA